MWRPPVAQLRVVNGGGGAVTDVVASSDQSWLTITPVTTESSGLGEYQINVDRATLSTGVHRATLTFHSSANTVTVPVLLQVGAVNLASDVSTQYVLLIDNTTQEVVEQRIGNFVDGVFSYQFGSVTFAADQRYIVVSGSDMDNDGYICSAGESCGAYLTHEQPLALNSTSELGAINFTSGFEVMVQQQAYRLQSTSGKGWRKGE